MELSRHDPSSASIPSVVKGQPDLVGVLLSRDLIFRTKIKETAAELGYRVLEAQTEAAARSLIETHRPKVVLVDLTAGDFVAPRALAAYRELTHGGAWLVAFGPHVEKEALAAARNAGCQVVLSRKRFVANLPGLLLTLSGAIALVPGERAQAQVEEHNETPLPRQAAE